jgi:pimeloyl-ACP methyl ester carboxylesterase
VHSALLVHGAGGGAWEWNCWDAVFQAQRIATTTIQLQPCTAGLEATTLEDYQAQVDAALQALPRPRALVGASLGGLLSAWCADRADALVLVNPFPAAPWHVSVPVRDWPDPIPWRRNARLASTRAAMHDADEACAVYAFRRWRDESGLALRQAQAGVAVARPRCPVLFVVSTRDEDIGVDGTQAWAQAWDARCVQTDALGHVGPLLGSGAPDIALQTVAWLNRIGAAG